MPGPPADPSVRSSSSRASRTRAALVEATTALVAEVGYQHTTTRAIAERAGVAEGTIYRHFPDKRALFLAAVLDGNRDVVAFLDDLPARAGRGPVAETLVDALVHLSSLRETVIPLELALASTPELRTPSAQLPVLPPDGPPARLAQYLRAEQDLGRIRADVDPVHAATVVLAALFGLQASPLTPPGGLSRAEIVATVDLLVRGLTQVARPAPRRRAGPSGR